ncbi:MAG: AMP-binding protein [Deltaproteobacteria bacterium]|nr:AMP-binding protein [Deltaproteobacteria bacterium]
MSDVVWRPTAEYAERANITRFMHKHGIKDYDELIKRSTDDIEWFWDAALKDIGIEWYKPYAKVLDDSKGFAWVKWFIGGKINIVHNCIDRHASSDREAFIWEGENGGVKIVTYKELNLDVCRAAAALHKIGIKKGDAVGLYMPMMPELVTVFFAALKIGAVAVPVFSGFGPEALGVRLNDAKAKILFTADAGFRKGKEVLLKENADAAVELAPSVEHIIIVKRLKGAAASWKEGRDIWWNDFISASPAEAETSKLDSEDAALIIYTSGTTGKPKGTVHTHAGALAQISKELCYYFDVKEGDRFFWLTDIGWMMGPWMIIGAAALGATFFMYEGTPNYPTAGRIWEMVERRKLTHIGISPTVVRLLMREDLSWVKKHDLSSLRILGSTGEPWDDESYKWFFENIGGGRCPIINISGGTELIGCLLSPLPITELKPCTLRGKGLGMDVDVFNEDGKSIVGEVGYLVCKKPFPSMTKGFLNDSKRFEETYFSKWKGVWNHGDWAYIDKDGFYFLRGRSDDTIKVAGKRVGPSEIEAALIETGFVSEAAAIGVPDELKGEAIVCFAVLKNEYKPVSAVSDELKKRVETSLGKTMKPKDIFFVGALPKTRSGKIVRGVIKRAFLNQPLGDTSSVENIKALEGIRKALPF